MDVTSLLNSSSAALQRRDSLDSSTPSAIGGTTAASTAVPTPSPDRTPFRRTSGSRSPNRNRTPWDAGGYSLPLTIDTKSIQTPSTARPAFYSESPTDGQASASPRSPKHKFSDSRSSLSSYTSSSNNSVSHSRISSLSTVSEFQPLASLITDISLNSRMPVEKLEPNAPRLPSLGDVKPISPNFANLRYEDSETLAGDTSPSDTVKSGRPGSPSDAVIIRRGQGASVSGSPPNSLLSADHSPTRPHKRAVSAPDFPAVTTSATLPHFAVMPDETPQLKAEPATDNSGLSPQRHSQHDLDLNADGPRCMYISNCNTGSAPRKVVSHIFGRNKLCTRSIPEKCWVCICRKHYQRCRYRNAQEYAKFQCELIIKQIQRVQAWSDANQREGKSGVVQDWSLTIRKRESNRLAAKTANNKRKRPRTDDSEDEEDSFSFDNDRALANGSAVPGWLLEKCGSGYTTEQIQDIAARLKREMDAEVLSAIPDIEILPNISSDGVEGKAKASPKRKGASHKRSQSMGVALRSQSRESSQTLTRRVSQSDASSMYEDQSITPEKRQRVDASNNFKLERQTLPSMPPRNTDRTVPQMQMRRISVSYRQPFGDIQENQAEDRFSPSHHHHSSVTTGSYSQGPLPAPTPQGPSGLPMAQQTDACQQGTFYDTSYVPRQQHQRSYSEVGGYQNSQLPYRPAPSTGYAPPRSSASFPPQSYAQGTQSYDTGSVYASDYMRQDNGYFNAPTLSSGPPIGYGYQQQTYYQSTGPSVNGPYGGGAKHTRHQSTPGAPSSSAGGQPLFQTGYTPRDSFPARH
ncbi:hypothetical protein B0T19DRAFT_161957 [Cercophora scortea]|uniref:Uncharacterized protein n=1 Tax=Cercophora scortea TaxID=314031 RepID=A0AAE0ILX0_9PEZI|nr:hypothetical protein B0T19DRAFT_161957 [Cercophora scortea]